MGILCNFSLLVIFCLNRPDKATLYTARRFLHHFCILRSEGAYSTGRTADAGAIFHPKSDVCVCCVFFFLSAYVCWFCFFLT